MCVCVCVCVCGALVEWCCVGKAKIIGSNPVPVTRCQSQIPNGLAWDWTWDSNVKSPTKDRLNYVAAQNLCSEFKWLRLQPGSRLCFSLIKFQDLRRQRIFWAVQRLSGSEEILWPCGSHRTAANKFTFKRTSTLWAKFLFRGFQRKRKDI